MLSAWLGVRSDGRWSAIKCGLAVPRQNGKNGILEMRELFGMVVLGERFLHTAHEVKTARKAFMRLASFFENERKYPELAALAQEVRRTNGQEAIVLSNGGSVEFIARSKGSGRGYTVDVLVMDEAQELSEDALEALLPTISAAPQGNPQQIYTGTPPGPKAIGEIFTRVRTDGVKRRDKRLAWDEWSVETMDPRWSEEERAAYVDDPRHLAATNPALGYRLQTDVAQAERGSMSIEGYARERLGMWDDSDDPNAPITAEMWGKLAVESFTPGAERPAFGIAVSMDRLRSVIGVAVPTGNGVHVELSDIGRGTGWVLQRVAELRERHPGAVFVLDPGSPAGSLVAEIEAAGVELEKVTAREYAQACAALYDGVHAGTVRHLPDLDLDRAAVGARQRSLGDLWAWARRDATVDVAPLEAVTLAAAFARPEASVYETREMRFLG